MSDLLKAELTKLRTLPATWIALVIALLADTVLGVLASSDAVRIGTSTVDQLGTLLLTPAYAFIAVAVIAAGNEFTGGQVRVSLLAVPNRNRLLGAKLAVTAVVSVLAAAVVILPGHLVQRAAEFEAFVAAYLLLGLVGHGLALLTRSAVTPLAGLLVAAVLVAPTLRGAFPEVVRMLPHDAALSLTGLAGDPAALSRAAGSLVLAGWAAVSVLLGWVAFARRDS